MSRTRRMIVQPLALSALAAGVIAGSGCQTYPAGLAGLTLPSGQYLKHYPQYFPPEPNFPLQRELDSMQDASLSVQRGNVAGAPASALPSPAGFGPPTAVGGAAPTIVPQATPPAGGPAPGGGR